MNDRDMLYQLFQMADEQRKRDNFNVFMDGFEGGLVNQLDKAYASEDIEKYEELKRNIKERTGARIFRNSKGEHKISFM